MGDFGLLHDVEMPGQSGLPQRRQSLIAVMDDLVSDLTGSRWVEIAKSYLGLMVRFDGDRYAQSACNARGGNETLALLLDRLLATPPAGDAAVIVRSLAPLLSLLQREAAPKAIVNLGAEGGWATTELQPTFWRCADWKICREPALIGDASGPMIRWYYEPCLKLPASGLLGKMSCQQWLEEMMKASPHRSPRPKTEIWNEASEKWKISERGFGRAWEAAIKATGAVVWQKSGPKGPRSEDRAENLSR